MAIGPIRQRTRGPSARCAALPSTPQPAIRHLCAPVLLQVAAELGAAEEPTEPTELEKAAEDKAKAFNVSPASTAASANVDDIMNKDADDEALQKYKAQVD